MGKIFSSGNILRCESFEMSDFFEDIFTMKAEVLRPSFSPIIAEKGSKVVIHATGYKLNEQNSFWSTKRDAKEVIFRVGRGEVIKGWDEGCDGMRKGEIRRLHLSPAYGYDRKGFPAFDIPPNAHLIFDVELIEVKGNLPDIDIKQKLPPGGKYKDTILFFHGWPDDERVFSSQISFLSEHGYRCLYYTLPWFGPKDQALRVAKERGFDKSGYIHEQLTDAIALNVCKVLQAKNGSDFQQPEKIIIVAHDWGAYHGQLFKVRHPHLVKKSVIIDVDVFKMAHLPSKEALIGSFMLGYAYQYKLVVAYWLSLLKLEGLAEWLHTSSAHAMRQGASKEYETGSPIQAYTYYSFQKHLLLRFLNLESSGSEFCHPGEVQKRATHKQLHQDTMFVYGSKKPKNFHSPGLEMLLNSSKKNYEKSCATSLPTSHWVSEDAPDELNNLIINYLENEQETVEKIKLHSKL